MNPKLDPQLRQRHPLIATLSQRPVTLTVLILATALVGMIVLQRMPVELYPPGLQSTNISIEVPLRSTQSRLSPKEMEERVTLIFEGELSTIPGILRLTAESSRSNSSFDIEFAGDTDIDEAYAQVRDRIDRAKTKSEEDIGHIRIRKAGRRMTSVAFLSIAFDQDVSNPFDKLRTRIQPAIESTQGVASFQAWGDVQPYYRVELKSELLRSSTQDLMAALNGDNFSAPMGKVRQGDQDTFVVLESRFSSLEELKNFPVAEGKLLRDVANVYEANGTSYYQYAYFWDELQKRYVGGRGLFCPIGKSSDANTVETSQALMQTIKELEADPTLKGVSFRMAWNQGDEILTQLKILAETLLLGGMLAVLVLMLFLKRLRLALIIALAIPLSMMLSLITMYFMGEILSAFALLGFTIVGGMLLDSAIVVSENIYRRFSIDASPQDAAVSGAAEVGLAITLATLTTVIVFLAMILLSEQPELAFYAARIGIPFSLALVFSIFVALAVIPFAMGRVFGGQQSGAVKVRNAYEDLYRKLAAVPGGRWLMFPIRLFFGRPTDVPDNTKVMDWLDAHVAKRLLLQVLLLVGGAVLGWYLSQWAYAALGGGDDFWGPVLEKFKPKEDPAAGGGGGGWARFFQKTASPHPSLVAMAVFGIATITPPLLVAMLPRKKQACEPTPIIARAADLYARVLKNALRVQPLALTVLLALVVSLLWLAPKFTEMARGGGGRSRDQVRMFVNFPSNTQEQMVEDASSAVGEFVSGSFRALAGLNEAQDLEEHRKAYAKYGLDYVSIGFNPRGARFFMGVNKDRMSEVAEIQKQVEKAIPKLPDFRSRGQFDATQGSGVRILLQGPEYTRLEAIAETLLPLIESLPGLVNVSDGTEEVAGSEMALDVDLARALAYGADPATVARVLAFELSGARVGDFRQGEITRPIQVVKAYPESRSGQERLTTLEDAMQTNVRGESGSVPVSSLTASRARDLGQTQTIRRENGLTTLAIEANFESAATSQTMDAINKLLNELELPPGYTAEATDAAPGAGGGRWRNRGGVFGGNSEGTQMGLILAAAGVFVYFIMGFLFESWILPFVVVLGCLPGAAIGGIYALILTDTPFDMQMGLLGAIVLIGVSVNNGIVLVDLISRLRREGLSASSAIVEAGRMRLRPMLMTSVTTSAGLLPMALGDLEFIGMSYAPMMRVILGGILVSTVTTLFAVPLLYSVVEGGAAWMRGAVLAFFVPTANKSRS